MTRARDNADLGDSYGVLGAGVTGGSGLTALGTVTAGTYNATIGSSATFPAKTIVKWEPVITTPTGSQGTDETYTDLTGSSVSYTPATGASYVVYEYSTTMCGDATDDKQFPFYWFYYDGSTVANTNFHIYMKDHNVDGIGYQHFKFILPAWSGAKTMSVKYRVYSDSYNLRFHQTTFSGDASGTDVYTKIYQSTYSVM